MNLLNLWNSIESYLFPCLEDGLGEELTKKEREFVRICSLAELDHYSYYLSNSYLGRKAKDRLSILKSFVAKAVYNLDSTRGLIDLLKASPSIRRLCGWETRNSIPHESKFSRVFSLIAESELCQQIHKHMITEHCKDRIVGHVSRDSTAIEGRERIEFFKENKVKTPKKRGRLRKGEVRIKEKTVVELQVDRSLEENLKSLPMHCNKGTKKNSKGYKVSWKGYKLHLDCIDGDIPANSPAIHQFSKKLGHKPIIDNNPRRGRQKKIFDSIDKLRYRERSTAERVNSNLKDNYGGRNIRVRGHKKVMAHLMFGILAITANQLFRLI